MRSGETDIAETVDIKEFEDIAKNISVHLKHMALLDVDCFKSNDGKIFVLEMNCRFGGQYPFTHVAGVDVPQQIINWLNGRIQIGICFTSRLVFPPVRKFCPRSSTRNSIFNIMRIVPY
jgi:hypothetical protein